MPETALETEKVSKPPTRKPPPPPVPPRPRRPGTPPPVPPRGAPAPQQSGDQQAGGGWTSASARHWTGAAPEGLGGGLGGLQNRRAPAPRTGPVIGTRGPKQEEVPEPPAASSKGWVITGVRQSGAHSETAKESTGVVDKYNRRTRTQATKTTTDSSAGLTGETTAEYSSTTDGGVTTTGKGTAKGLVGADVHTERLTKATATEMSTMVSYLARAGVFGEANGRLAVDYGKLHAAVDGYASGGAGVQSEGSAGASMKIKGLLTSFEATVSQAVQVGLWGEAGGSAEAGVGPVLARIEARISAFVGAQAKFSARTFASLSEGVGFQADASAMAGARAELTGLATLHVGSVAMEVSGGIVTFAGAQASASGGVTVDLTGVTITGKASAFAGVKAELTGKAALTLRGREIISAQGKIGVSAGVGVEAGGTFGFQAGKVTIYGEIAGALKGGFSLGGGGSVDFKALAIGIGEEVADAYKKDERMKTIKGAGFTRVPIADKDLSEAKHKLAEDTVYAEFAKYARKKEVKGENGVKEAEIEKIIHSRLGDLDFTLIETDRGIEAAARRAFGPLLEDFRLDRGNLVAFKAMSGEALTELKDDKQKLAAYRQASKHLTKDLDDYAQKKAHTGEHGVKRPKVQEIIDKRWDELAEAYGPEQAPSVVTGLVKATLGAYLTAFSMKEGGRPGEIGDFDAPEEAAKAVKQSARDTDEATAAISSMSSLRDKLDLLKRVSISAVVAKSSRSRDQKKLTKQLGATPLVSKEAIQKVIDDWIADEKPKLTQDTALKYMAKLIGITLDPLVKADSVKMWGTKVVAFEPGQSAESMVLDQAAKESEKAQTEAVDALSDAAEAYVNRVLRGGYEVLGKAVPLGRRPTITQAGVQKLVDDVAKKVPDQVRIGRLDTRLTRALYEALAPVHATVDVVNGRVRLTVDETSLAEAQRLFAQSGTQKVLGETTENRRAQIVAQQLDKPLAQYRQQIEADALRSARAGTPPKLVPSKEGLQAVIDRHLGPYRSEVHNLVGASELQRVLDERLGLGERASSTGHVPMFSALTVKFSQLDTCVATPDYARKLAAAKDSQSGLGRAREQLLTDLQAYVRNCDAQGLEPSQSLVQAIVAKHKDKFATLEPAERDMMLLSMINQAMPGRLRELKVQGGSVTMAFKGLIGGHRR